MKLTKNMNSLHLIPVVLAATAIFMISPAASAASIQFCSDGDGSVCQISGVTIDSNSYTVTFSYTPDFTFSADPSGAANAITTALWSNSCYTCFLGVNNQLEDAIPKNFYGPGYGTDQFFVAGPDAQSFVWTFMYNNIGGGEWGLQPVWVCAGCGNPYPLNYSTGNIDVYANFNAESGTPEPGSMVTMFGGVAILVLLRRKRRNHQN